MKRFALAAVAVIALASFATATAAHDNSKPNATRHVKPPKRCLLPAFRSFSAEVWRPSHWDRPGGKPKPGTVKAMKRRVRCAPPGHRKAMKARWLKDKRQFGKHRQARLDERDYEDAITPPGIDVLEAIASCESGGDPTAVSSDGSYRGKYQFSFETWASVGGSGDPAAAPEREQDERAALLYNTAGSGQWPVCGV